MGAFDLRLDSDVLDQRWGEFRQNGERARDLAGGLSEEQLWWREDESSWSVGECLDHLVRTGEAYLEVIDPALEKARSQGRRPLGSPRRNFLERFLVKGVEPPVRMKIPAPSRARPQRPGEGRVSTASPLDSFVELRERFAERLERSDGIDLQRTKLRSPFLSILPLSLDTAFAVVSAHERRHLGQAQRVLDHPGFPAA